MEMAICQCEIYQTCYVCRGTSRDLSVRSGPVPPVAPERTSGTVAASHYLGVDTPVTADKEGLLTHVELETRLRDEAAGLLDYRPRTRELLIDAADTLAAARAAQATAEQELRVIDSLLARRPALDQPTRGENIAKAIRIAGEIDPAGRIAHLEYGLHAARADTGKAEQELDEARERVALFSRQLSVQEARTGEWHRAHDEVAAQLARAREALQAHSHDWHIAFGHGGDWTACDNAACMADRALLGERAHDP